MTLDALLFDIDGTLADTDPIHFSAWADQCKKHGYDLSREVYRTQMSGRLNPDIIRDFFPKLSDEEVRIFDEEKEIAYRERALQLTSIAGLQKVLEFAQSHNLRLAAVTNGSKPNAEHTLNVLRLNTTFEYVITPDLVEHGKPDPEPYLLALDKLGVDARKTLVFEDSPSGIRAAQAAALEVIGLSTSLTVEELNELGVALVIPDFAAPELWERLNG